MKISFAFAAGVLAGASILPVTAIAADAPPGALSCSGCHSPNATEDSTPPRLIGRDPAKTPWRRCRNFAAGSAPPRGEGLHPGRDPGHRNLVRRAEIDGRRRP